MWPAYAASRTSASRQAGQRGKPFGWANRSVGDEQRGAVKRNSVRLARLGPKRAKVAAIPVRERRYRPALLTTRGGTNDLTWRQGGVASQVVVHQVKRLNQIVVQR